MKTKHVLILVPVGHIDEANELASEIAEYQAPGIETFSHTAQVEGDTAQYSLATTYLTDEKYDTVNTFTQSCGGHTIILSTWNGAGWDRDLSMAQAIADLGLSMIEIADAPV